MVKQVSANLIANTIVTETNSLTTVTATPVQVVDVSSPTYNPLSNLNVNNNYGIQANNVYITGYPVTNQITLNSTPNQLFTSVPYGSQEYINIGAYPNDGTGDPLRVAFEKINNNFSNLFSTTYNASEAITTGTTPNQVILENPANTFMQGTFIIKSYNPNNIDMQNITLSAAITNDQSDVKFTGYATTFNGNAVCTYDMDVYNNYVRVLINPLSNVELKHYISYQITNSSIVEGLTLELDGYPSGSVLGTEDDLDIITEDI